MEREIQKGFMKSSTVSALGNLGHRQSAAEETSKSARDVRFRPPSLPVMAVDFWPLRESRS